MNAALTRWQTAIPCAAIILSLIGCGGGSSSSSTQTPATPPSLTSGGAASVYAVEEQMGSFFILQLAATANGAVVPSSTLELPYPFAVGCIATDTLGQIYVGGGNGEVLVYAPGSTGVATPTRTISVGTLDSLESMVVDASGQLYVLTGSANGYGVLVYAPNANGAATPIRTIQGPLTLFNADGSAVAVDPAGTVYVATLGTSDLAQIYAFAPGLSGNVAPTRTVSAASTSYSNLYAIDTDSAGNIYVIGLAPGTSIVSTIYEFASTASGVATPVRTIAGVNASLANVRALHVDAAGNIYIGAASTDKIPVHYFAAFASTAAGNIGPSITFTASTGPNIDYEFALK